MSVAVNVDGLLIIGLVIAGVFLWSLSRALPSKGKRALMALAIVCLPPLLIVWLIKHVYDDLKKD